MDRAIQIGFGQTEEVSASAVKQRFHGCIPSNIQFLCPLCRRPVSACAMQERNVYPPYFKHKQDDPVAQKCDWFSRAYGYSSVYKRAPLPMYISPSKDHEGRFLIKVGLRPIGGEHIGDFESNHSRLWIDNDCFDITRSRFCGSTFKAMIKQLSMKPSRQIKIENLPKKYEQYWGSVEDPLHAMVFSHDPISGHGRRLYVGDSLCTETPFYFVTEERESSLLLRSIVDAKRVGTVGCRGNFLVVLEASIPGQGRPRQKAEAYLGRCGFSVADLNPTPVAVWPPALQGAGDVIPLFKKTPSVFIATMTDGQMRRDYLYQYSDEDRLGNPRRFPLIRVRETDFGLCVMKRTRLFCYVGSQNSTFSTAALLRDMDLEKLSIDKCDDLLLCIRKEERNERSEIAIRPQAPILVKKMQVGQPQIEIAPDNDNQYVFHLGQNEAILVKTAPPDYPTQRVLRWIDNKSTRTVEEIDREGLRVAVFRGTSASIAFLRLGYPIHDGTSHAAALHGTGTSIAFSRLGHPVKTNTSNEIGYTDFAALLRARRKNEMV